MTMKPAPKPTSPHALNQAELKISMYLPVAIAVGLVGLGVLVWLVTPDDFNTGLAIGICSLLLIFLIWWTRHEPARRRILALLFAVPAIVGVSYGMSNGRTGPIVVGTVLTGLLLILYRSLTIPLSYRFAYRRWRAGDDEAALDLLDRSLAARPDFWESHQLRALIFLAQQDYPRAERAARDAVATQPEAGATHNTLGQVRLMQADYGAAREAFIDAVECEPDNALFWYHLGLCQYRLAELAPAADSLLAASKRSPRILEYELLEHYYLWRCLNDLDQAEQAADIHEKMQKFAAGLTSLEAQADNEGDTPYLQAFTPDLADMRRQLTSAPEATGA